MTEKNCKRMPRRNLNIFSMSGENGAHDFSCFFLEIASISFLRFISVNLYILVLSINDRV